ncbi:MAG TPA: M20/M25/M40 family metallo-hydrolase [Planctomycetota bacterium]|nr:M20/M25/M40 family metallo-hydrolase [Planctomycetota bacterium]
MLPFAAARRRAAPRVAALLVALAVPLPAQDAALRDRLRQHVEVLASPDFAGRGTGQHGFERAAAYVSEQMARIGLEPLGDDGTYRQAVPWTRVEGDPAQCRVRGEAGGEVVELAPGPDFAGRVWFDQDATGAPLDVRVPADGDVALDAEEARGKVLLVELTGADLDARFAGPDGAAAWTALQAKLRAPGPAAVLFVDDARARRLGGLEGTTAPGRGSPTRGAERRPNELFVSRAARDRLLALGAGATVRVAIVLREAPAPACNVVGRLRGADEAARDEHVVIGCHLDHLGVKDGVVYPGADDDASGTAAVLALAEALAAAPDRPRRSLVFVAFCGEEVGLQGSRHFVHHCPVPLPSIVAELQLDMIGRSEEGAHETREQNANSLHLIGTEKLSADLHRLCVELNRAAGGFALEWDQEDVFWRSDHVNFARMGVPVAFFFTGFHADYHQPTDTADKIEWDKLERVTRYVQAVARRLADDEERPHVDQAAWRKHREALRGPVEPAAPLRR